MPIRRTSNKSGRSSGFYTPEVYNDLGSRPVRLGPGGAPLPILWYDFADETTVTVSSSQITEVTSIGSQQRTLTKSSTGPAYVDGINGLKCLDWGNVAHQNFLRNTNSTSTTIGEVYVVLDASFGGSFTNFNGLMTGTGASAWYFLGSPNSDNFTESGTNFNRVFINGGATDRFGTAFDLPSIDSPCILRINSSNSTTFNATDGFQIGNDRSNWNLNRGWFGLIGEYVIYSSVLSESNRSLVMNYLANKWAITLL